MNIKLKPFQKTRVSELCQKAAVAQMSLMHFGQKQIISLTAPTGAGKTIMMASFIESMFCGDEDGITVPAPDSIFIWLSDSPELNEQSKQKLIRYCDRLVISQFHTLDDSFRGEKLESGKIYFLNTQKLTRTSNMTKTGDGRDWTIWETLENSIEAYGDKLVLVIDEAHRGARTNQTSTMQKFVKGSPNDGLQPLPFVIGMSATPERFNTLAGASLSTLSKVVVTPSEVRESGLLKDTIEIHYPEDSVINKNIAVLHAAADEWKDKCLHWYNYTEKQHYSNVCPIFVIQVEPSAQGRVSATDLDECIREVEKRTGEKFEEGEVVHAFGEQTTLTINGLKVPYCQPSAINDDRNIKIVLFKEALSTGWDCPRAETMMSYRVARDATYIAQLLGRMIRTPLRMRIEVDESLNYVHLYLPHFDVDTVENVVNRLTEEEGGALPTEIQAVQGGKKTTVVMTTKRPLVLTTNPQSGVEFSVEITHTKPAAVEIAVLTEQTFNTPETSSTTEIISGVSCGDSVSNENQHKTTGNGTVVFVSENDSSIIDPFEKVKDAINQADILTYEVKTVAVTKNYLRSLFDLARLAVMYRMDPHCKAVEKVKDDISEKIYNYICELKTIGQYQTLINKALEFQLNTLTVQLYKSNDSYDSQQGPDLFSKTDAGLNYQYQQAETLLCGEGIGRRYADKYEDEKEDENAYMYDVILYVANQHQKDLLMDYAKYEFYRLADLYRPMTKNIPEKARQQYNSLVSQGSVISKHLFQLPDTINVDLDNDGEVCSDHLFVNSEGTAKFKLVGWEPITLNEERKHPKYVCWLRNQDRKPWALCIPYKYGNEDHRMYPDFIIVRNDGQGGYDFSILEPHRDDKKDNLAKAKGLAQYAIECPSFSRIQMLRKVHFPYGDRMLRLDFTKMSVREKVNQCVTEADFDKVFTSEGFYDIPIDKI